MFINKEELLKNILFQLTQGIFLCLNYWIQIIKSKISNLEISIKRIVMVYGSMNSAK
jgi:hypothetical protein